MDTNTLPLVAWAGLVAGVLHALTGPDHLAGVAPFAASRGARAWRVGAAWGLGHAAGALAAAALALALRALIPGVEEQLSAFSERAVGVLLVAIGVLGLHALVRARAHTHAHEHDGNAHAHLHVHVWPWGRSAETHRHGHGPFALGSLHGAAGLSHLFAVIPALALPGVLAPASFLAAYALGCLASVTVFASVLGRIATPSRVRFVFGASSVASLAVGLVWIVHPF